MQRIAMKYENNSYEVYYKLLLNVIQEINYEINMMLIISLFAASIHSRSDICISNGW
jgi:hypothetical protein